MGRIIWSWYNKNVTHSDVHPFIIPLLILKERKTDIIELKINFTPKFIKKSKPINFCNVLLVNNFNQRY
jgi:hypothetical protein